MSVFNNNHAMKLSDRLILEKPVQQDFKRFHEINADPETNLFNPNGAMSLETAQKAFDEILKHWEVNGFGVWRVREKENPEFVIGFGGLSDRLYGTETKLNLGYRFDKDYWGKGYATELAKHAIAFGFKELDKKEIFAIVRPKHLSSINVLEKCKMKLFGELNDVQNEESSLIYSIENTGTFNH
jgi:RimJ/RimL family protein N-acetyltransferase